METSLVLRLLKMKTCPVSKLLKQKTSLPIYTDVSHTMNSDVIVECF